MFPVFALVFASPRIRLRRIWHLHLQIGFSNKKNQLKLGSIHHSAGKGEATVVKIDKFKMKWFIYKGDLDTDKNETFLLILFRGNKK